MKEKNMQELTDNIFINWSTVNNQNQSGDYSTTIPIGLPLNFPVQVPIGDPIPGNVGSVWTYPQVVDYYYHYYPIMYPEIRIERSKVDLAFRILKVLQDKGIINVTKVKIFIELVDSISKEL
jgi:hypothetical protein